MQNLKWKLLNNQALSGQERLELHKYLLTLEKDQVLACAAKEAFKGSACLEIFEPEYQQLFNEDQLEEWYLDKLRGE